MGQFFSSRFRIRVAEALFAFFFFSTASVILGVFCPEEPICAIEGSMRTIFDMIHRPMK